jgi:hypothetical protein
MVQDILSDMDSDEVNSINDTTEAQQVAQILQTTYYEIIDGKEWPHLDTLVQLEASGDSALPTHMRMPENLQYIEWVKYNKKLSTDTKDKYINIEYLTPKEFMDYTTQRTSSASNIDSITDSSSVVLFIRNDIAPTYWTSFNDKYLVFDSYDSTVDTTLQASKTQATGRRDATFTISDTFTPDLPAKAFSYYLSEAKSVCFNALKQTANPKEEQRATRQRYRMSGDKWRHDGGVVYKSFGRK